jgi:U1 small nuclear ribonucleoprotein
MFLLASMDTLLSTRPPLEYIKPFDKSSYSNLEGIIEPDRNYCSLFENGPPPKRPKVGNYRENKEREWKEKMIDHIKKVKEEMKNWDPNLNPKATHDPYKTLFVSNLDKNTDEKYLKRVFETYGEVRKVVIVRDLKGVSRGYGFVEFANYEDYKSLLFNYL